VLRVTAENRQIQPEPHSSKGRAEIAV